MEYDKTESGLYRISAKIIDTFYRDYEQRVEANQISQFLNEINLRIRREDPILFNFFENIFGKFPDKKKMEFFAGGAAIMYELLRRQAESKTLEEYSK